MRIALDTNLLVYAEGVGDSRRCSIARDWVRRLPVGEVILPAQVLGELFRVLVGKAGLSAAEGRDRVLEWAGVFPIVPSSAGAFMAAFDLAVDHQWSIWDALMGAVAAEAGCGTWLSEDLQEGFSWRGVTVRNPFLPSSLAWLESIGPRDR